MGSGILFLIVQVMLMLGLQPWCTGAELLVSCKYIIFYIKLKLRVYILFVFFSFYTFISIFYIISNL